ncbi:MAG TPA: RNB domain-containing ribonuclease, partial [Actinomycetota bacterium]|nr:RNB domain-containing ribonuclease [Actinomycetota bacterium]
MISPRIRLETTAAELIGGFQRIREEMQLPGGFPPDVESEALRVSERLPSEGGPRRTPRLDIDFLTIDPPGSKDLDQAFHGSIAPGGYRISYAIADLGHFVDPGGALDHESGVRGKTFYCPDLSVPLYPPTISESAGSLLPGQLKPAVLWSFDLDREGIVRRTSVERAVVRSSRQLTYQQGQEEVDSGQPAAALRVLKEVGILRLKLEEQRGGIDLKLPDQEVRRTAGGFELSYREELPIEAWNAQISLMTGMAAAAVMLEGGVGLLRTLPEPDQETVQMLRLSAEALEL